MTIGQSNGGEILVADDSSMHNLRKVDSSGFDELSLHLASLRRLYSRIEPKKSVWSNVTFNFHGQTARLGGHRIFWWPVPGITTETIGL